jgi:hypothetical protein
MYFVSDPDKARLNTINIPEPLNEIMQETHELIKDYITIIRDTHSYIYNWQFVYTMYILFEQYTKAYGKPERPLCRILVQEQNYYGYFQDTMKHVQANTHYYDKDIVNIHIVEITRNKTDFFNALDVHSDTYPDNKGLSVLMQEDRYHKIRICCNTEQNTYYIFTSKMNYNLGRKITAILPKLLKCVTTDKDLELLKAYAGDNPENWFAFIKQAYAAHLAQGLERFQNKLETFGKDLNKKNINFYTANIARINENIIVRINELDRLYKELETSQHILFGIQNEVNENFTEFIDYILKHPALKYLEIINSEYIKFWVTTPLNYYDLDAFKMIQRNKNSALNTYSETFIDLMCKVFIENTFTIWTESVFVINFTQGYIGPSHSHHTGNLSGQTRNYAVWQPHVVPERYHCWGNNLPHINKALHDKKYIPAWEQIIAATQNINFTDTTVVNDFWYRINNDQKNLPLIQDNNNPEMRYSYVQYLEKFVKEY